MSNTSGFANRGLDAQHVEHRSDNVVGYVIVEKWRGTQPGILGRLRSKSSQEENIELLQSRLAPNPSVAYELAKVSIVPKITIIPEPPVKLPETKWWGAAA